MATTKPLPSSPVLRALAVDDRRRAERSDALRAAGSGWMTECRDLWDSEGDDDVDLAGCASPGAVALPYQPFWCEENVWHLAQRPEPGDGERLVLVVTGAAGCFAAWQQRDTPLDSPVVWDYHVVLAAGGPAWSVWDLDTRLGCPVPANRWLNASFPCPELTPRELWPRFAVFPAGEFVERFGSDRSHMRRSDGGWQRPPPPWPMISGSDLSLAEAVVLARRGLDLAQLAVRLG